MYFISFLRNIKIPAMNRRSLYQEKLNHQSMKRNSCILPKETTAHATLFPCRDNQARRLSNGPSSDGDDNEVQQTNKLRNVVGLLSPVADDQRAAAVNVEIINKSTVGTLRPVPRKTNSPEVQRRPGQRPQRHAVSMHGELLARSDNNAQHRRHCQDANRKLENCRSLADKGAYAGCGSTLTIIGGGVGFNKLSTVADVTARSDFMNCSDRDGANSQPQPLIQSDSDVGVNGIRYNSGSCCAAEAQPYEKEGGSEKELQEYSETTVGTTAGKMKEENRVVVTNETVDLLRKDSSSTDVPQCDAASPSLRVRSLRRPPTGARKQSDGSKSASPSPGASPVLPHFSTSGSATDDTASNGDDGSGDDDEDDDGMQIC